MRELMQMNALFPPNFESTREPDQFVATFLFHHLLDKDDVQWIKSFGLVDFADDEIRALIFVRELGAIDNSSLRSISKLDILAASSLLRHLRDLDLLEMRGGGNKTYYIRGPKFKIHHSGPLGTGNDPHQSVKNRAKQSIAENLPERLKNKIEAAGARPRKEKLRELILELCEIHELSAKELGRLLGDRGVKGLVRTHLKNMVENCVITLEQFTAGQLAKGKLSCDLALPSFRSDTALGRTVQIAEGEFQCDAWLSLL